MLQTTVRSSFSNQGEICLCGSRIFIEKPIYEKFKSDFIRLTQELKIGDPSLKETQQGAIVSEEHKKKIEMKKDQRDAIIREKKAKEEAIRLEKQKKKERRNLKKKKK